MEEHQTKKRDKKNKNKEYRAFDRDRDLRGVHSKDAFKAMFTNNQTDDMFDERNAKYL